MRGWVGVTDDRWARFLAERPEETGSLVNFWKPSGGSFKAIEVGEPFFFKTHAPHNRVVGGGFFSGHALMPVSEAWETYGEANGASSLDRMLELITRYRQRQGKPVGIDEDPVIGCSFIRDVTFFPDEIAPEPPPKFASNIVIGKGYDLADPEVAGYFNDLMQLVLGKPIELDFSQPWHATGPVFGEPRLAPNRLAQGAFRAVVLTAYHDRCAITGTRIRPVLQAAHIRPVGKAGENRIDNGLSLRSDVHTMFDNGYLSISPEHKLLVSPRLRTDFGNGKQFYDMAGEDIAVLPDRKTNWPNPEFLQWHVKEVYKASLYARHSAGRRRTAADGLGSRC